MRLRQILLFIISGALILVILQLLYTLDDTEENDTRRWLRDKESQSNSSTVPLDISESQRMYHHNTPLLLYVGIFTAREFRIRRQTIRDTWLQDCVPKSKVICKFFTDGLDEFGRPINNKTRRSLQTESLLNNNDLVLLNSPGGMNNALRFLVMFEYVTRVSKFEYFLRIDDDQYLCMERLLKELPFRPKRRLYWGVVHCQERM